MSLLHRVLLAFLELGVSAVLSVLAVYWSYRGLSRANPDFGIEEGVLGGNAAAALLAAALMGGTAMILREAVYPIVALAVVGLGGGYGAPYLAAYAAGHLAFAFLLAAACVQAALRLFSALASQYDEQKEIRRGNLAAAFLLAAVVLVVSTFARQAASSVSKSMIPQPVLGDVVLSSAP